MGITGFELLRASIGALPLAGGTRPPLIEAFPLSQAVALTDKVITFFLKA